MWSAGCILSEFMTFTDSYRDNGMNANDRILFPGNSCFPLSPSTEAKDNDDNFVSINDQLRIIIEILGD